AADLPGSVFLVEPAPVGGRYRLAAAARAPRRQPRGAEAARARDPRSRRARTPLRAELSESALARATPARRDRARTGDAARAGDLRRADFSARRIGAIADPQPAARPAARA